MPKKDGTERESIAAHLQACGYSRRDFLSLCTMLMATAPVGLALTDKTTPEAVAKTVGKAKRPSVVWLHFQDCTGCSETLLRTSKPDVASLILDVISLDYHETLMVASGHQAEAALDQAVKENAGKFILVVEGSIPKKDGGVYMKLAGKNAIDVLKEVGSKAAAVVSMGSCASWGGVPSTPTAGGASPTEAVGVDKIITDKPVINIPGCPPNPYTLLGVVLEVAALGKVPALDAEKRPKFAFDRVIHDHCPRRAHFDAGRFAGSFGDEGHKQGWCLFKLGCKGPVTHASCSTRHFNEVPDCWPIGIGAPCVGCTEQTIAFKVPIFQTVDVHSFTATPPDGYPLVSGQSGSLSAIATGLVGLIAGAAGGAAWVAGKKLDEAESEAPKASAQSGGK
ncbi:MAG TPA: hydrogenase small subunit [candidate division Zixibacteria bacterium]|nr:hydrogenase small subunit [candidate division Zixibacteria bacterium]